MDNKPSVRLELTPDQQQQLREVCGKGSDYLEFTVEELEQRIAPAIVAVNGGGNTPQGIGYWGR